MTVRIGAPNRAYVVSNFVGELGDGTLKYDVVLVDRERGIELPMRLCVFDGEPVSCESQSTREQTQKVPAVKPSSFASLIAYPGTNELKNN